MNAAFAAMMLAFNHYFIVLEHKTPCLDTIAIFERSCIEQGLDTDPTIIIYIEKPCK